MKKWNDYETTQVMGVKRKLPAGGYICRILSATEEDYGWGTVLAIAFDIAEGDYKNFYREQFEKQSKDKKWKGIYRLNCPTDSGEEKDERLKKTFKTFMHHVEQSNEGYKWDWSESSLRGKFFGGIFGEKEYEIEGNTGFFTTLRYTSEAKAAAHTPVPKPLLLNKTSQSTSEAQPQVAWGSDEALPF